jgi:ribonuclease BN (tRNA processing enzyme)
MTTADAGRSARESEAKTLLATHFWPDYDVALLQQEIEKEYNGRIIMADHDLTVPI